MNTITEKYLLRKKAQMILNRYLLSIKHDKQQVKNVEKMLKAFLRIRINGLTQDTFHTKLFRKIVNS